MKDPESSPYYQMDPDNINYRHTANYQVYQDLFTNLPEGWMRLPSSELKPGQPPYLHQPSGRTSFRHPNSRVIMKLGSGNSNMMGGNSPNAKVKKLRLLLQAGAPLGAVEQKARMEGVDIKLVLSHSSSNNGKEGEELQAAIPEMLLKKYKRMIKAGLPLDRVQQLAGVETGVSPEEIERILGNNDTITNNADAQVKDGNEKEVNAKYAKFARMQQAGIPLAAIQNSARIQGMDVDELNKVLGVMTEDFEAKKVSGRVAKEEEVMQDLVRALNGEFGMVGDGADASIDSRDDTADSNETTTDEPETFIKHFVPNGVNISFPTGRDHPLTDLVRKMAHTVQKTSRFNNASTANEMMVDNQTLYHALGAFKGIQFARNEYNSTLLDTSMNSELVHAKRHAFAEMARSIGMPMSDDEEEVPIDIPGLDELIAHIDSTNRHEIHRAKTQLQDGYYDFDSLQAMYKPGSFVIAKHSGGGGVDSMCQVVWNRYTQGKTIFGKPMKFFELCVRFIVPIGGGKATFAEVVEGMEMFEGTRSLSSSAVGLAFVPLLDGQHDVGIADRYKHRGELYNRIVSSPDDNNGHSYAYMAYEKGSFFAKHGGRSNSTKPSAALAMGGRIIIDFDAATENGHFLSIGRDDMIDGIRLKLKEYKTNQQVLAQKKEEAVGASDMILFSQIPGEYCHLTWPTMAGFSLTSKSWGDVITDGLRDIVFDPDVFDRLVLPETRKRMIKALVRHTNSMSGFQDLIKGKGAGTVFLLYGLPGTGKTLTAEALAELLGRPLYSISMGTLGTTADELEHRLGEILQLSERWDALLLLDEADSFLEARSSNSSLERNAMVSVMLRLVEYHQGIMFLTSNRIDSIDPAFKTRITLAMQYETLDIEGRAKVWENLLVKSGYSGVMHTLDLRALSKFPLNGREIKNALRIAMALAADDESGISQKLLVDTAMVVRDSNDTMKTDSSVKMTSKCRRWSWRSLQKI
ncbi:hypothetical protein ACHAXN_001232 [Cyclotella atomus]